MGSGHKIGFGKDHFFKGKGLTYTQKQTEAKEKMPIPKKRKVNIKKEHRKKEIINNHSLSVNIQRIPEG